MCSLNRQVAPKRDATKIRDKILEPQGDVVVKLAVLKAEKANEIKHTTHCTRRKHGNIRDSGDGKMVTVMIAMIATSKIWKASGCDTNMKYCQNLRALMMIIMATTQRMILRRLATMVPKMKRKKMEFLALREEC